MANLREQVPPALYIYFDTLPQMFDKFTYRPVDPVRALTQKDPMPIKVKKDALLVFGTQ